MKGYSTGPLLAVPLKLPAESAATESDNCDCAAHRPKHAGLLEPGTDNSRSSGSTTPDRRTTSFLEMWEAHAVAVSIEVVGLDTDGVDQLEAGILSGLGGQVKSGQ